MSELAEIIELRERIKKSGLPSQAIADKAGVSKQIVLNIASGKAKNVTLATFHAIRNALKRGGRRVNQ